jgi:hypothetical protein
MLRQQLSAKAAACALIFAPLCGLVAVGAWPPLRSGDRAQIAAITAASGRWYVFSLFLLLSTYLLVPAVLALMRLLSYTRPVWALLAGSIALLGILVGIGDSATELMYWQMGSPHASLAQMAALASRYDSAPGASLIYLIGGMSTLVGTILLSIGLWRAHAVPAWAAGGMAAATVINIVGLSSNSVPLTIVSFALMLGAFARVAVIVARSRPPTASSPSPASPAAVPGMAMPVQN